MGPERKDKLQSPDELQRMRQESDALIATSKRLLHEMQLLLDTAHKLVEKQAQMVKRRKPGKSDPS